MSEMTIAIVGGRTGGHLFPALAVAESLMKLDKNVSQYMIGTADGIESRVAPDLGYEFHAVRAIPFRRGMSIRNLAIPFVLAVGTAQSLALLRRKRTSAVFATGGFVCVPVLAAAVLGRIRIFMQEQNSYPGLTTRLFAKRAESIFAAYSVVRDYLHPDSKVVETGNPLRFGFESVDPAEGMRHFGLDPERKTLLIFGGSQGAEAINSYIAENLERLKSKSDLQIIWQTGRIGSAEYAARFKESEAPGVIIEFIERMDLAYACADLVISRAGAITLAELAAMRKPAILVPYPFAAENHQEYNARVVEKRGAAVLVKQSQMIDLDMISMALGLLDDEQSLKRMAESSGALHSPGAADTIARTIISEISK